MMKYMSFTMIALAMATFAAPISAQDAPQIIELDMSKLSFGQGKISENEITAKGPQGDLAGSYINAGDDSPVILIIPGSGPTDRNGNNPQGVSANSYQLLAQALHAKGISTLRIDKRGMFGSKAALANANDVTIAAYADDVRSWNDIITAKTGQKCIWVAGHSEGGLVALAAANRQEKLAQNQENRPSNICGVITISAAGRSLDDVLRNQLQSNPANAPILSDALSALDRLKAKETVDVSAMHPALQGLFNPAVQPYLIDLFSYDPAQLTASLDMPLMVVQGDNDIQISTQDAYLLAGDAHEAVIIAGMNHVLKHIATKDRAANLASYRSPDQPISPLLVDAISEFVT